MKSKKTVWLCMITVSMLFACLCSGNGESGKAYDVGSKVYIAGHYNNRACYWNNYKKVDMSEGERSYARSIYVSGSDVYVAGEYNSQACYWKNRTRVDLSPGKLSSTTSIFIAGDDVYVSGSIRGTEMSTDCYWKNGNKTDITDIPAGTVSYKANSIFVSGSDIYIAGFYAKTPWRTACYWKNGGRVDLPGGAEAKSIYVAGSDVFVAGGGSYWKNGAIYNLGEGFAYSIMIAGIDVYVGGFTSNSRASYWKNGILTTLPLPSKSYDGAHGFSIYASGDDVYVAGHSVLDPERGLYHACYWKNGKAINLSDGVRSEAYSVFVKP